jgi:hypothetical protein
MEKLDGSCSADDDDGIVSYHWVQTAGKPVKLSDPGAIITTFRVPLTTAAGETFTFKLIITDAGGLQDTAKVMISVKDP